MLYYLKNIYSSSFVSKMSQSVKRQIQRAVRVQENTLSHNYSVQHQAKIRQKVSVESSIQNLEDQMRQEISRSLKRSENKVIGLIQQADQSYKKLNNAQKTAHQIEKHNQLIKQCQKARWEFMVHRQAIGFTIKNHELVTSIYKIPPRIE